MTLSHRLNATLAALLTASLLAACGGSNDSSSTASVTTPTTPTVPGTLPQQPGAPVLSGNTATDGYNWFNYRRAQAGLSTLTRNAQIDAAAAGHSNYLRLNNLVSHDQVSGKSGFTGAQLSDRLRSAGYTLSASGFAYGEVISGAGDASGFYHAEELVAAIYHRFVIFEPVFKEMGTGAATGNGNYTYFTADFVASNGLGPGVGRGNAANYPAANQTQVPANFFSDNESPDPVPSQNEVGYPVSMHADNGSPITVQRFTLRPRGGSDLAVRLLTNANDEHTPLNAAAIVPLAALRANTVYEVSFNGTVAGVPLSRDWAFTTK